MHVYVSDGVRFVCVYMNVSVYMCVNACMHICVCLHVNDGVCV